MIKNLGDFLIEQTATLQREQNKSEQHGTKSAKMIASDLYHGRLLAKVRNGLQKVWCEGVIVATKRCKKKMSKMVEFGVRRSVTRRAQQ